MKIRYPKATIYLTDGSYIELSDLTDLIAGWIGGRDLAGCRVHVPIKSVLYIEEDDDED